MVEYGYEAGYTAIRKQIIPATAKHGGDFTKYTFDLLNRTVPGWMK